MTRKVFYFIAKSHEKEVITILIMIGDLCKIYTCAYTLTGLGSSIFLCFANKNYIHIEYKDQIYRVIIQGKQIDNN